MTVKNIEIPVISEDDLKKIVEESAAKSVCGEDTHKNDAVDSEAVNEKEKSHTRKDERVSIYDLLEEEIMKADMPEADKTKRLSRLLKIRGRKVNIMLTGATGSGKSSTINALFNMEVAKVGVGVDPETDCIAKYELDNLTIWDTPGLGDGVESEVVYFRFKEKEKPGVMV